MPFLLFLSLEPCGHVMRVWGGEEKKEVDVWVYGCFRISGCVGV